MSALDITIVREGKTQTAKLIGDSKVPTLTFCRSDGYEKTYQGKNYYVCLANLRSDHPDTDFLCKGAKLNVHPSSMSAQMSLGLKAYELTIGVNACLSQVVYIFDYEDENLTRDPQAQRHFFQQWRASKKS